VTFDAMRIQTGRPGVFSENPAALTDSFVIRRAQPANEGMGEAQMANHANTRTTQLYDRRREELSLDEVERIRV
jgi:hypothetical protein